MPLLQENEGKENCVRNLVLQKLQIKVYRKSLYFIIKMVTHKCFDCGKIIKAEYLKKKVRCPYCGSRVLYKPRVVSSKVKTD